MYKEITGKLSCILCIAAIIMLGILAVLVGITSTASIDAIFVVIAYIISVIVFNAYVLYSERKRVSVPIWYRNDMLGLLMCTNVTSILISGLLGVLLKWSLRVLETSIIILLIIFSIIWFGFKIKKYKESFAEFEKNVQIMTTFITLISIALTDIPNPFLRVLFIVIGFGYTIIECVLQNIVYVSKNMKSNVLEMAESSYNTKSQRVMLKQERKRKNAVERTKHKIFFKKRKPKVKRKILRCIDYLKKMESVFRLLEVMAVVIGSIFIANRTNQIVDIQLKKAEADMQPNFQVVGNLVSNHKGEKNANSIVEIENLGGKCSNINVSHACFIKYTEFRESISITTRVELDGFYFANFHTGQSNGQICVLSGEDNWKNYTDFSKQVLNNRVEAFIDLERYLRIIYQDQLNQYQVRYYKVDEIDTEMLNEEQGQKIFREYEEKNVKLDINNLSLDELKKVISKANQ